MRLLPKRFALSGLLLALLSIFNFALLFSINLSSVSAKESEIRNVALNRPMLNLGMTMITDNSEVTGIKVFDPIDLRAWFHGGPRNVQTIRLHVDEILRIYPNVDPRVDVYKMGETWWEHLATADLSSGWNEIEVNESSDKFKLEFQGGRVRELNVNEYQLISPGGESIYEGKVPLYYPDPMVRIVDGNLSNYAYMTEGQIYRVYLRRVFNVEYVKIYVQGFKSFPQGGGSVPTIKVSCSDGSGQYQHYYLRSPQEGENTLEIGNDCQFVRVKLMNYDWARLNEFEVWGH